MRYWIILLFPILAQAAPVAHVYNHTNAPYYTNVPQWKLDILYQQRFNIAGESHGRWIRYGFPLLSNLAPAYKCDTNVSDGVPHGTNVAGLRVDGYTRGDIDGTNAWVLGYGEADWYTTQQAVDYTLSGIAYVNSYVTNVPMAMGFGWCWDMYWHNDVGGYTNPVYQTRWAGSSDGGPEGDARWGLTGDDYQYTSNSVCMTNYIYATEQYIAFCSNQSYATTIIWTTGPQDSKSDEERAYQWYLKNQSIRDYVSTNGGWLFDYADIVSWNPTNNCYSRTNSWTDHGDTPHSWYAYADQQNDLSPCWTNAHVIEAVAMELAKVAWVMLADMIPDTNTPAALPAMNVSGTLRAGRITRP